MVKEIQTHVAEEAEEDGTGAGSWHKVAAAHLETQRMGRGKRGL